MSFEQNYGVHDPEVIEDPSIFEPETDDLDYEIEMFLQQEEHTLQRLKKIDKELRSKGGI